MLARPAWRGPTPPPGARAAQQAPDTRAATPAASTFSIQGGEPSAVLAQSANYAAQQPDHRKVEGYTPSFTHFLIFHLQY
jgi:hypothetical protein